MTDDDWVGLFVHSPLMGSANGVLYNLRGVEIRIRWLGTRGFRPQGTRYHESWLAEDTVIYTIRLWWVTVYLCQVKAWSVSTVTTAAGL